MELILTILLGTVLCVFILWCFNTTPRNFPPGPYGLPLVGYLPFLGKYPHQTFAKLAKKYGNVFSVRLGDTRVVLLNDWPAIKEVLVNQSNIFNGRPKNLILKVFCNYQDIVFSEGPEWKERRRFALQCLRDHGFGKSRMETVIMDEIHKSLDSLTAEKERKIKLNNYFHFYFCNIIWNFVGGKSHQKEDQIGKDMSEILEGMFPQFTNTNPIAFMPCLRYLFAKQYAEFKEYDKKLEDFVQKEIDAHISTYQDGAGHDFADSFLNEMSKRQRNGESMSSFKTDNLMKIAKDLFLAGIDTNTNYIEWSLLYMATWPTIQQKVQEELDHVIGRERLPTVNDRPKLKYTDAVLWESHRYCSLVPLSLPHTNTSETQLFEYHLPKGTVVFPNLWAINNDPTLWNDPEIYRPERFLNDKGEVEKPEYFIPFSTGGRVCLGESLARTSGFLFFTCLLHRFSFSLVPDEKIPSLDPLYRVTMTPEPFSLYVALR